MQVIKQWWSPIILLENLYSHLILFFSLKTEQNKSKKKYCPRHPVQQRYTQEEMKWDNLKATHQAFEVVTIKELNQTLEKN